jgi:hypothetical protein
VVPVAGTSVCASNYIQSSASNIRERHIVDIVQFLRIGIVDPDKSGYRCGTAVQS